MLSGRVNLYGALPVSSVSVLTASIRIVMMTFKDPHSSRFLAAVAGGLVCYNYDAHLSWLSHWSTDLMGLCPQKHCSRGLCPAFLHHCSINTVCRQLFNLRPCASKHSHPIRYVFCISRTDDHWLSSLPLASPCILSGPAIMASVEYGSDPRDVERETLHCARSLTQRIRPLPSNWYKMSTEFIGFGALTSCYFE